MIRANSLETAVMESVFDNALHHDHYCIFFCFAVCGAPKRRFRPYAPAVAKDANETDIRKTRKAQIQRDEAFG